MTQSILLRRSTTAGAVPAASVFDTQTFAVNHADGLLYWRDTNGIVQSLSLRAGQTNVEGSIASAATTDLSSQPVEELMITGTVAITSFGTGKNLAKQIRFAGALTLTNSANLIIPGGANITTAAGDCAYVTSDSSGNWRVRQYTKADGTALVSPTFTIPPDYLRTGAAQGFAAANRVQGRTNLRTMGWGIAGISQATTLDATSIGKSIYCFTGGYTVTMPAVANFANGESIEITNISGTPITLAIPDSNCNFYAGKGYVANTITLYPGCSLLIQCDGSNYLCFNQAPNIAATPNSDYSQSFTAAQLAQLYTNLGLNTVGAQSFRNRIINGNFVVAQRYSGANNAVSLGSSSLSAGQFFADRWKAGSGGATAKVDAAASGDSVLTISAGTMAQVIEGKVHLVEGGTYILSWAGTATARWLPAGGSNSAYAASPIVMTGLTAGANLTVEFATGTVTQVQVEPGTKATPFERYGITQEYFRCARYFVANAMKFSVGGNNNGSYMASYIGGSVLLPVPMRASPTLALYDLGGNANCVSGGNGNGNQLNAGGLGQQYSQLITMDALLASGAVTYWWACLFQASAEL